MSAARDFATLAEKALAHQRDLDLTTRYLTVQILADRWSLSVTTVRDIPRKQLPYIEFGKGVKLKRRRYHPDDVAAYEERERHPEADAAA